jgi:collagenase-like PrtC family protease
MELLEGLAQIPEVSSIYAKLPYDIMGGGRSGAVLPAVNWEGAGRYIRAAHDRGISFCYLANAPCLGNLEQTPEGRERILEYIGRLIELGVDSVSIANLAVVALVRRNFPDLPIRGSVLSWPTNLPRLKHQEGLGIDPLILPYSDFNRDFPALQRIRSGLACGFQLFVNIACIYQCSYLAEHANSVGHASQAVENPRKSNSFLDFYLWQCTRRRLLQPELFLMSRWIRPEDLHVYEDMGYDEFKIIDRSRSTAWLLRAARAYAQRRYDGNLLDILSLEMLGDANGFHQAVEAQICQYMLKAQPAERELMLKMLKIRKQLLALDIYIDNQALSGFLDGFRKIRCAETSCEECRYCQRHAERAVRFDRTEAGRLVKEIDGLLDGFLAGPTAARA